MFRANFDFRNFQVLNLELTVERKRFSLHFFETVFYSADLNVQIELLKTLCTVKKTKMTEKNINDEFIVKCFQSNYSLVTEKQI